VDIKKIDLKKKLMAGSVMAVMSGFVPPVIDSAIAGTATVAIDVDIVTAVTLTGTNGLDFGRLALTGAAITGAHVLTPAGATPTVANGASVVATGTPGNFNIAGGTLAGNVLITAGAGAVTYGGGVISLDQVRLGGAGIVGTVTIAAGATGTANFAGGLNTDVQMGGRLQFANPGLGNYTGNSIVININDIP
jgi:hypothetical protein